ncbi:MAG: peptide chain release factor N(5)-glutamine methyltransferase [Lachnospiraceae bacterium]|nr:peptide chain release factor N(5)-glutamine methyltransferase [Lachnospiraceae bacterium]
MKTYKRVYEEGKNVLEKANVTEAALDARLLLEHICGTNRNDLILHGDRELLPEQIRTYEEYIQKRAGHIPFQHITGLQEFMGLDFQVNEDVLIPRQDTERLVELVLQESKAGSRVLDMCTGSGCILLSILAKGKEMQGIGVDISEKALTVARNNAKRLGINKAEFVLSDMFAQIKDGEKFDVITSNPPYIESGVIPTLMEEVRVYEPLNALDGGADGLEFYRILAQDAEKHLNPGGRIYMEIGYNQGKAVQDLFLDAGYDFVKVYQDYAGLDRVVVCGKTELI